MELREAMWTLIVGSNWQRVRVRALDWVETIGAKMRFELNDIDEIFSIFPRADPYIADARSEYLLTKHSDRIYELERELAGDENSRRAVIVNYDWYWEGHPWCILGVQFLIRNGKLLSFLYLRSSNLYRALPYDLHALLTLRDKLATRLMVDVGEIYYFATSAHVFERDWTEFLRNFGVSPSEVRVY